MKRPKDLTPLEWEIMNTVLEFEQFPVTVRQILEQAYPKGQKAYTTVQTIMNHLTDKGFLQRQKIGPVNVYRPKVSAEKLRKNEMSRFVEKVFGGSFFSLANFLVHSNQLTPKELAELQNMLDKKSKGQNND